MRPVHKELAEPVARGLLGAATIDGGPTDEQVHIIDALLHGYFDVDTDLTSLEPIDPAGLAAAIEDPKARHRVVELMIVLEFSRHPGSDAMAQRVQEYAAALDVDEKMQVVARDALHAARAELNADYQRYHDDYDVEPRSPAQRMPKWQGGSDSWNIARPTASGARTSTSTSATASTSRASRVAAT